VLVEALERRPLDLSQVGWMKRMREGIGKPVPRHEENALERRLKPKRASAQAGFRRWTVRILAGSKALELRGIVTFWFSEQKHAMSGTA
jgi:hypothetical protein